MTVPKRKALLLGGSLVVIFLAVLYIGTVKLSVFELSLTSGDDTFVQPIRLRAKGREELRQNIRAQYERQLSFYGIVLDEHGAPIPEARAEITWTDLSARATSKAIVTTGADGRFSLTGKKGKSGTVRVGKAGYHERRDVNPFSFDLVEVSRPDFYRPDTDKPVVFVLQKRLPSESIIHWTKSHQFHARQGTAYFALLSGKVTSEREADLTINFSADRTGRGLPYYNWKCEVIVRNGGLATRTRDFAFLAPEGGYLERDIIAMGADVKNYQWNAKKHYFVRARDGQLYARVLVQMVVGDDPFVWVTAHVNPSGSRNLDFDAQAHGHSVQAP